MAGFPLQGLPDEWSGTFTMCHPLLYYLSMERNCAKILILPILMFAAGILFSQEGPGVYTIAQSHYEIEGKTRESALERFLDMPGDLIFPDYASMNAYAERRGQDLLNLRVFERVETELVPLKQTENGVIPYILKIRVKDGWTFFPLIVPTFDTNDNLALKWKINYANVMGSLVEFNIDGEFGVQQNFVDSGLEINYWNLETGFSNIYFNGISYTFFWRQAYARIIEKNGTEIIDFYTFNKSDFFLAGTFDLGDDYFYEVAPAFEFTYNYKDKMETRSTPLKREPQSYGIYQKGGRNQVDWKGNFQTGNNWEAELQSRIVPTQGLKGALFLSNRWFTIFNSRFSYNNRILAFSAYNEELYALGEYMRGIPDFNLSGDRGLFLNQTLPVSLFNWKGVMETQIQPFMDFGMVHPSNRELVPEKDIRMSLGSDLVFFPEKVKSVNLRFTFGFDLFGPGPLSERYEILLSTKLFY
ncbi:hypothetical protein [Oceanispirochaeta sp.]|jgi:hypothetical protein|uniref:hypothetical protein n=1 Tax=Oceanispirochaeta sp. TaxID=2035350 RepID=UPI00260B29A9|nr:hypothetical protein [Oceanispirochaeta sp.]MDA3956031.1 hypothetical protein [Oceanispirochaeta sp.]